MVHSLCWVSLLCPCTLALFVLLLCAAPGACTWRGCCAEGAESALVCTYGYSGGTRRDEAACGSHAGYGASVCDASATTVSASDSIT
eukprot:1560502-Amphidinium_carterae.1